MTQQKRVGSHKTTVKNKDGQVIVSYWNTDVFKYDNNTNILSLNTDGWFTNTTKTRMNQALNEFMGKGRVYQENNNWFLEINGYEFEFDGFSLEVDLNEWC